MTRLAILMRREVRERVLSKSFLIYLLLLLAPAGAGGWFSYALHQDPSALIKITELLPSGPIAKVTASVSMMIFADIFMIPMILTAVLQGGDSIAGEQSRGTLLLLISKPIHRWEIVLAKYASFLIIFTPLTAASTLIMSLSVAAVGIGRVGTDLFLGYLTSFIATEIVYVSIATLFSSCTRRSLTAVAAALVFAVLWMMLDLVIPYMPQETAEALKVLSPTNYTNGILSYLSQGKALPSIMGGFKATVSSTEFLRSLAVVTALILVPLSLSLIALETRDIHGQ